MKKRGDITPEQYRALKRQAFRGLREDLIKMLRKAKRWTKELLEKLPYAKIKVLASKFVMGGAVTKEVCF
jgi:hypothetical protein